MDPFLAVFAEPSAENCLDLQGILEKNTPVDFLIITEKAGANNTYRYTTVKNILNDFTEIQNDYATILIIGETAQQMLRNHSLSQNGENGPVICFVDPTLKSLSSKVEFDEELMRYFSINGYQILINDIPQKCMGLTLSEFEALTGSKCLENREELDKLLRAEAPIHIKFFDQNLTSFLFLQSQLTPQSRAIIQMQNNNPSIEKSSSIPVFTMARPNLELWVYAKPFATLGSLTFDLQKFLKEVGHRKEAIKSGAFSQNSSLNEQNLLFMDDFSPDNELELTFNMDTMREELNSKATKQGFQLLGERISKSARLLLLKKNAKF